MRPAEAGLLMLCCALGQEVVPLTSAQYSALARRMAASAPKKDGQADAAFFRGLGYDSTEAARLEGLLNRETVLRRYLAQEPSVQTVTRISPEFPQRLRVLGEECPAALFCRGDIQLLRKPCVALVGSRRILRENRAFARHMGALAAREGYVLVSGGAAGADSAAQEACLSAGGKVICIVPNQLSNYPLRENILFCSLEGYELPFSGRRALARNHIIHALGKMTFVAQCGPGQGGTWSGTTDNLRRNLSEVYVWWDASEGMQGLCDLGASPLREFPVSLRSVKPQQLSIFDDISGESRKM